MAARRPAASRLTHTSRTGTFAQVSPDAPAGLTYLLEAEPAQLTLAVRTADARLGSGTLSINDNAPYSTSRDVTLSITAPPGAVGMRLSNDTTPTGSYQPISSPLPWTLADSDGTRTVHLQFRDANGNTSDPVSDSIILDRKAPRLTIQPPTSSTSAALIDADEPVLNATTTNITLRHDSTGTLIPLTLTCTSSTGTTVDCTSGPSRRITTQPTTPLLPGASYTLTIHGPSSTPDPITDRASNPTSHIDQTFTLAL